MARLELFCNTTAVFVSCICSSVTYVSGVSVVVQKRQTGLHRGKRKNRNPVQKESLVNNAFC